MKPGLPEAGLGPACGHLPPSLLLRPVEIFLKEGLLEGAPMSTPRRP